MFVMTDTDSLITEDSSCLADYFTDINYIDQVAHFFLLSYLIVVLVRLGRVRDVSFSICDAHLIDAVCQISTVGLIFATFRILRKENFNMEVPVVGVLLGVLLSITTFTFGISVGRSWGLAEAMLQGNDGIASPSGGRSNKRTIRPKISNSNSHHKPHAPGTTVTAAAAAVHYSSDDSSLMSQSSSSRKRTGGNSRVPDSNSISNSSSSNSSNSRRKEEEEKKKQLEHATVESIYETVESAKVALLSNLELNLLPAGKTAASAGDNSEWKLVRTGYSSHIWLSKQRVRHSSSSLSSGSTSERVNNIMIKASCFSVMSVTDVALFLHEHDITTGLECIIKHRTPLQTLRNR